MGSVDQVYIRLSRKWLVPPGVLRDIHALMTHDTRFYTEVRGLPGIKYKKMHKHLQAVYKIYEINERQLRYLVKEIKRRKNKDLSNK